MSSFDESIALLSKLSNGELTKLRDRITALLAMGGGREAVEDVGDEATFALQCILDTLEELHVPCAKPLVALKNPKAMSSFRPKAVLVLKYFKQGGFERNERRRMLMMGVTFLHQDLVQRGKTATAQILMLEFDRIVALFDKKGFPYDLHLVKKLLSRRRAHGNANQVGDHTALRVLRRRKARSNSMGACPETD